jgi:Cupin-like domain
MSGIKLKPISKVQGLDKKAFEERYMRSNTPVVMTDLIQDSPAFEKWTPEFFKNTHGENLVPVYDLSYAQAGSTYMKSTKEIPFSTYIENLLEKNMDMRIFLYNIIKKIPVLKLDLKIPRIVDKMDERFVFLFFGCKGSVTPLHFDIDMAHVLHTNLYGRKRWVLFAPSESRNLYQHPMTVRSYVDVNNPDLNKFPRLQNIKEGYEVILERGETLFIPSGYWHLVEYPESSFGLSMRVRAQKASTRLHGLFNILFKNIPDRLLNRFLGQSWLTIKEKLSRL